MTSDNKFDLSSATTAAIAKYQKNLVLIRNRLKGVNQEIAERLTEEVRNIGELIPAIEVSETTTLRLRSYFLAVHSISLSAVIISEAVADNALSESEYINWIKDAAVTSLCEGLFNLPFVSQIKMLLDRETK